MVDIDAESLTSGYLAGAGIDVFPDEPEGKNDPFVSALQGLTNVILNHTLAADPRGTRKFGDAAFKMLSYMDKGVRLAAYHTRISLPTHPAARRILHIHHNKPGILSAINTVISKQNLNIVGQYLNTNQYGLYVDIEGSKAKLTCTN